MATFTSSSFGLGISSANFRRVSYLCLYGVTGPAQDASGTTIVETPTTSLSSGAQAVISNMPAAVATALNNGTAVAVEKRISIPPGTTAGQAATRLKAIYSQQLPILQGQYNDKHRFTQFVTVQINPTV